MRNFVVLFLLAISVAQAQDVVRFRAEIANRNTDMVTIQGKNFKKEIKVNNKGVFEDSFAVEKGMYQMYDGVEYAQMFLKNGFDLNLKMDAKQFDESIVWTGKGADENNYIAQGVLADEKLEMEMATAKDQAAFADVIMARTKADEARLNKGNFDEDFKSKMQQQNKTAGFQMMRMFLDSRATQKLEGVASPDFNYENFKGGKTSLSSLKGKYVYIDTWATWCGPCRAEIPHLKRIEEKYHDKKIEFVSISIDVAKDHEKWQKFVKEKNLGGIQLFADNDWNSEWVKAFGINSIPRFILVGPDGKVISSNADRPSSPMLEQQLDKLLN